MKKAMDTFQKWMTAITFAEAGEWDMANPDERDKCLTDHFLEKKQENGLKGTKQMSPAHVPSREINQFEQCYMAAAFAEAGLYEDAIRIADGLDYQSPSLDNFLQSLGLDGVCVRYGVLAVDR